MDYITRLRKVLKPYLPEPLRGVLRGLLEYATRHFRWLVVLCQIRGVSWLDELKLVASALMSLITSLRHLNEWQDPQLLFDCKIRVRGIFQFKIRRFTDDLYAVLPFRERAVLKEIQSLLRPGDCFVDAGANIGFYSIAASRWVGPKGCVIAIEMMPDTAAILRSNIEINGCNNVHVIEYALSSKDGEDVVARVKEGKHGQASFVVNNNGLRTVSVRTITLDKLSTDIDHVRLMKMDLEGAEALALKGAVQLLSKTDVIIFESLEGINDGEVEKCLYDAGYTVNSLSEQEKIARRLDMKA